MGLQKEQLIEKEKETEKESKEEEKQVNELKQKVREYYSKQTRGLFKILNKIYEIRKNHADMYSLRDLSRETVIREYLSLNQIYYIFSLKKFTKKAWEMIEQGKITIGYLCQLVSKSPLLVKGGLDHVLEKVENGEIEPKEIRFLSKYDVNKMIKKGSYSIEINRVNYYLSKLKQVALEISEGEKTKLKEELKDFIEEL